MKNFPFALTIFCTLSTTFLAQAQAQTLKPAPAKAEANNIKIEKLKPEEAIKQGLAAIDARDFAKALQIFDTNFKDGHAESGFYMGRMAELGLGMTANSGAAAVLYKSAAEKGSTKAINRIALMHYRGEAGVLQDFSAARANFCKAADLGEADAMFNCAEIQNEGKGGDRDFSTALKYYTKAADKDHIGAINILGFLYRDSKDLPQDKAKSRKFFEKSGNKGNPVGLFEVARLFEEEKDTVKAHMLYNLASQRNHPRAPESIQRLSSSMSNEDINKAQNLAKAWKSTP
jgi:uncharacterized protein